MRIISIEGGIGSGKTELTKFLSHDLSIAYILEKYDQNPFLSGFYQSAGVDFENELTFLLLHYNQLHQRMDQDLNQIYIVDFSIEKDLVFARENLYDTELELFEKLYEYVVSKVGFPEITIFLNVSADRSWNFVKKRGREYEIKSGKIFIERYNRRLKEYFFHAAKSKVFSIDAEELSFDGGNSVYSTIKNKVKEFV